MWSSRQAFKSRRIASLMNASAVSIGPMEINLYLNFNVREQHYVVMRPSNPNSLDVSKEIVSSALAGQGRSIGRSGGNCSAVILFNLSITVTGLTHVVPGAIPIVRTDLAVSTIGSDAGHQGAGSLPTPG